MKEIEGRRRKQELLGRNRLCPIVSKTNALVSELSPKVASRGQPTIEQVSYLVRAKVDELGVNRFRVERDGYGSQPQDAVAGGTCGRFGERSADDHAAGFTYCAGRYQGPVPADQPELWRV